MEEQIQNFSWSSFPDQWGSSNYTWIDTYIVIKVASMIAGGGGGGFAGPRVGKILHPNKTIDDLKRGLTDDEFEHFVKVVCKVNGISTEEIKKREDKKKPIVKIKEIENTIEKVISPKITVKMISRSDI